MTIVANITIASVSSPHFKLFEKWLNLEDAIIN